MLARGVPQSQMAFGPLLLILIVAVVFAAIVILLLKRRRPPGAEQTQGACGKCGYSVIGLTTFACPECGSDLREVGIVNAGSRGSVSFVAILAVALFVLFGFFCGGLVMWPSAGPGPMPVPPPRVQSSPASNGGAVDGEQSLDREWVGEAP